MIHIVDDGCRIVRLSGPVIILFSDANSCNIWKCYVFFNRLGPTSATRRLHVAFFLLKYILVISISILLDK